MCKNVLELESLCIGQTSRDALTVCFGPVEFKIKYQTVQDMVSLMKKAKRENEDLHGEDGLYVEFSKDDDPESYFDDGERLWCKIKFQHFEFSYLTEKQFIKIGKAFSKFLKWRNSVRSFDQSIFAYEVKL